MIIVRTQSGDISVASEAEVLNLLYKGKCKGGDFAFDTNKQSWVTVCSLSSIAPLFANRPDIKLEKLMIYVFQPVLKPHQIGPFSVSEVKNKIAIGELSPSNWIFVEGDKEWRQIKQVKAFKDVIPQAPKDAPGIEKGGFPAAPTTTKSASSDFEVGLGDGLEIEKEKTLPGLMIGPATNPLNLGSVGDKKPGFDPLAGVDSGPTKAAEPVAASGVNFPGLPKASEPSISLDINVNQNTGPVTRTAVTTETGSIKVSGLGETSTSLEANLIDTGVSQEETTKTFSALGLNLQSSDAPPPAPGQVSAPELSVSLGGSSGAIGATVGLPTGAPKPPGFPPIPPPNAGVSMPATPGAAPDSIPAESDAANDGDSFDGITAEIPTEPMWLIKAGTSETAIGPLRFLEVVKFLNDGKINKNDKISKAGTNRFCKIAQQYEFNVKFTIETVVEGGVEKQKIFIRRRHPRVPYMANIQIQRHGQMIQGNCINISAGGILMEAPKATFALGETLSIKILPGLIHATISCDALVIGKVPKIPPGYALKFKELKASDKEAIDFFVQETLKREQQRAI